MSNAYLPILRRAIAGMRAGSRITADSVRYEFDQAGVPKQHRGPTFARACATGLLEHTPERRATTHKPGNSRKIDVYEIIQEVPLADYQHDPPAAA
jgi:hypothetical protein